MEKLKMQTKNIADENFRKLSEMFPNVVTEIIDENGKVVRAIDKDALLQEISCEVVEGKEERYEFTWPDKKKAKLLASSPINSALRPCKEESVDFDNTQNLYIEGDNLDVLKLLRETYLGKIKMIYIDPPYNTGKDFVYNDNFAESIEEYKEISGDYDEEGNRLVENTESNGRFHTDWLNMIYPRLIIARDLLTDDGVIFISIDDNEVDNLRKICNDVFGESNFESIIKWRRRSNQPNDATKMIATVSEYIIVYCKNSKRLKELKSFGTVELSENRIASYTNPDNDPNGAWSTTPWCASKGQGGSRYVITTPTGKVYDEVWLGTEETFSKHLLDNKIIFTSNGEGKPRKKVYLKDAILKGQSAIDFWVGEKFGDNLSATADIKQIFNLDRVFDYTKPIKMIKTLIKLGVPQDGLILDFFSGSATTAHAVMQLNTEDGGNRKFIMVQLPEKCDAKSEAYKAGYSNICEIGKERIRRAGSKIIAKMIEDNEPEEKIDAMDTGFRVLKLDSSNMKDVYYNPVDYEANLFDVLEDNIKEDRTPMDLLFQVMLELGVPLSSKIDEEEIQGKKVFNVANGHLLACFDSDLTNEVIEQIAKQKPVYFVMRDSSAASDSVAINFDQIFATYSNDTVRRVL